MYSVLCAMHAGQEACGTGTLDIRRSSQQLPSEGAVVFLL
jgi:hypothetical protein